MLAFTWERFACKSALLMATNNCPFFTLSPTFTGTSVTYPIMRVLKLALLTAWMVPLAVKNGVWLFSFIELTFTGMAVVDSVGFFSSLPQLVVKMAKINKAVVYTVFICYYALVKNCK